jgi:hypothetical protein
MIIVSNGTSFAWSLVMARAKRPENHKKQNKAETEPKTQKGRKREKRCAAGFQLPVPTMHENVGGI